MRHYTGFLDWRRFTMATIRDLPGINWVLKPHPMEEWYGGYSLASLSREAGAQTTILPVATNTSTVMAAADCIVTVHGTVGCEAVANGVPVIAALGGDPAGGAGE
jgi:capsule polysaccharide modification protein KpsS